MQVYEMGSMVSAIATTRIAARPPAPSPLENALVLLIAAKLLNL
jgi:hypothetical protein